MSSHRAASPGEGWLLTSTASVRVQSKPPLRLHGFCRSAPCGYHLWCGGPIQIPHRAHLAGEMFDGRLRRPVANDDWMVETAGVEPASGASSRSAYNTAILCGRRSPPWRQADSASVHRRLEPGSALGCGSGFPEVAVIGSYFGDSVATPAVCRGSINPVEAVSSPCNALSRLCRDFAHKNTRSAKLAGLVFGAGSRTRTDSAEVGSLPFFRWNYTGSSGATGRT